ncbi:DUF7529 family protein [Halosegnis marinus]|uniref:Uncharacterized protein n=1 Tax=Halosegnis marinus TaxID=3034023 RepID=A0ABD5ZKZ3_9EURY|nr:hypothetical protein [Halosegnis sp. DT85]
MSDEHAEDIDAEATGAPAFAAGGTADAIREHWDDLLDDMAATAAEFREAGWDVLELHPGDVTVVTERQRGFDVLLPDDEFERLHKWVEADEFPDHDVYRAESGIAFLLVVLKDSDAERAVCCPLYYGDDGAETLRTLAAEDGELWTHLRRLSNEYVHVRHEYPAPFFGAAE